MNIIEDLSTNAQDLSARLVALAIVFILIWIVHCLILAAINRSAKRIDSMDMIDWSVPILYVARQPIRYLALSLMIVASVQIMGFNEATVTFATRLARTLVIIALFVALFRAIDQLAFSKNRLKAFTGLDIQGELLPFVRTGAQIIIMSIAMVIIVQEWDYDVSGLVAGLGLGGLAFSLAAQDTLANLFSFSTIVADQPFVVGEFIITPDVQGIVEKVGLRSTRIRHLDQSLITIPNSTLANSPITNWSRLSKRWIEMNIGLTYNSTADDIEAFIKRTKEMLEAHESVFNGSIQVVFNGFGDSSLNVLVRCYIDVVDWYVWMKHQEAISMKLMRIVDDLGLSMAFPSRSVYVENIPKDLAQLTAQSASSSER